MGNGGEEGLKRRAALVSLAFNTLSTILKFIAAAFTGSVSLLSEAIHSTTDVVSSAIALVSVRAAMAPPDEEHPYGHGKIESLAGFGEAILLLLIVVYILVEAVHRLITGAEVTQLKLGMWVMALSAIGSLCASLYVTRIAKQTRSMALLGNGQHLRVDFWTSVGVFAALALTLLTGWKNADSVVAIGLAFWIAWGAWHLTVTAFHQLIDQRLPDEELAQIQAILAQEGVISHHKLRTRLSGNMRYIDMHIVVPNDWSVVDAHNLADALEKEIEGALAPAQVVVHVDPFDATKAQ